MPSPLQLGPYLLLERLHHGRDAQVHLAQAPGDAAERWVALKQLDGPAGPRREAALADARFAAELKHPNLVKVYEVGESGGVPWVAMEYVAGVNLGGLRRDVLRPGEALELDVAIFVASEACEALEQLHRRGKVHGALCPDHVLVSFDGEVKVTNPSPARAAALTVKEAASLPPEQLGYLSPEQALLGQPPAARSDLFSLCAILFELFTGHPLHQRATSGETLGQLSSGQLPAIAGLNPYLPDELGQALLKGLSYEPEARYADASELQDALLPFLSTGVASGLGLAELLQSRLAPAQRGAEVPTDAPPSAKGEVPWDPDLTRVQRPDLPLLAKVRETDDLDDPQATQLYDAAAIRDELARHPPPSPDPEPTPTPAVPRPVLEPPTHPASPVAPAAPAPKRRPRAWLWAAVAGGLLAAVVAALTLGGGDHQTPVKVQVLPKVAARVTVGGRLLGLEPLLLPPGSYELVAEATGYLRHSQRVAIVEGERSAEFTVRLTPVPPRVAESGDAAPAPPSPPSASPTSFEATFTSPVEGLEVTLDGRVIGTTPDVPPQQLEIDRPHHYVVKGRDYLALKGTVAYAGEPSVQVPLAPVRVARQAKAAVRKGFLTCTSQPAGADIIVDGAPTDRKTPVDAKEPIALKVGKHTVKLELEGRLESEPRTIEVKEDETVELTNVPVDREMRL